MHRMHVLAAASVIAFAPAFALAAAKTPAPADAQSGAVIAGRVTSIDYQQGMLTVATGNGPVDVATMPTTSVQSSEPGYHAITDVTRGSTVQIFTARIAGKLVAEIIRLVKR